MSPTKEVRRQLREGIVSHLPLTAENMHHRCPRCGRWKAETGQHMNLMALKACLRGHAAKAVVEAAA